MNTKPSVLLMLVFSACGDGVESDHAEAELVCLRAKTICEQSVDTIHGCDPNREWKVPLPPDKCEAEPEMVSGCLLLEFTDCAALEAAIDACIYEYQPESVLAPLREKMECAEWGAKPEPTPMMGQSGAQCTGTAHSCGSIGLSVCGKQWGCSVNFGSDWMGTSDDNCEGSARACEDFSDEERCEDQNGCRWE